MDADPTWSGGTWSVRHHADPLDAAGEEEVLLAIFRRAYGLEPMVAPVPLSSY